MNRPSIFDKEKARYSICNLLSVRIFGLEKSHYTKNYDFQSYPLKIHRDLKICNNIGFLEGSRNELSESRLEI